jgi:hypothetical protein
MNCVECGKPIEGRASKISAHLHLHPCCWLDILDRNPPGWLPSPGAYGRFESLHLEGDVLVVTSTITGKALCRLNKGDGPGEWNE